MVDRSLSEKKDWSNYCATTNNRNQCGKNCILFPICKIKIPQELAVEKLKYFVLGLPSLQEVEMMKEIDKIFGDLK